MNPKNERVAMLCERLDLDYKYHYNTYVYRLGYSSKKYLKTYSQYSSIKSMRLISIPSFSATFTAS